MSQPALASLALPFRHRFLTFAELTAQLKAWAHFFPEVARLQSLGASEEGREVWLLTLGREPERRRPSVFVNGNLHATELAGSSVALCIAEELLRLHVEPGALRMGLPAHVLEGLRDVVVHVAPRLAPDGAEVVLKEGRYVRSNPRDRRPEPRTRWLPQDLDGDGLALLMRQEDPTGEFVEASEVAGFLVPRQLEDAGPFYKLYPEGLIAHWDGHTVPDPGVLSDNDTDLNRNFPYAWAHEPVQAGAGALPLSEPEARCVSEYAVQHPEIFAWLDLHTFGGVFVRPLGDQPDSALDGFERALFRQLETWAKDCTGYPMVSGFEEFTYGPSEPLHGALAEFAYSQRGALGFTCELWDLFAELGIPRRRPFMDHYSMFTREDFIKLGRWDATHNQGRMVRPWTKLKHPQLGEVEVGGLDTRTGLSNPPLERLDELGHKQSAFLLRLAALAPRLHLDVQVRELGPGVRRVEATVENRGYLPSYGLPSARILPWNIPVAVEFEPGEGAVVAPDERRQAVGHLEGWGRGAGGSGSAVYFLRSKGSVSKGFAAATVTGAGALTVRAVSPRAGEVTVKVQT
jgi:hypothetical protein